MFQTLLQFLDNASKNFLETLKRFPIVSFFAFLLTLILVIFQDSGHQIIEHYPNYIVASKVAFVSTLAIPLFMVFRLISNNRLLTLLGMGLIVSYYIFLPDSFENNHMLIQRHILFILALIILIFPAPFLFRSIKNAKFWEWTQQVIFAFISAWLFGLILYLGLQGGMYAFEKLFSFEIHHSLSKQLLVVIFGIFSTNYFLAQVPKYPLLVPLRPYTKVENIFTKYLLTPLSIAYFFILYIYTFKLIYLFELPSGLLAWLILIFSAVAIVTFLFWTPLWSKRSSKYKKWIWIAILLQTLLLGLSIFLRIEQYGITENRYFIALMGVWLVFTSLYFILYKNALFKWIFLALSLLIISTQVGPFSAHKVAQKSQVKQLSKLLSQNPKLTEESDLNIRYQISSSIDYLYTKHGIDSLMPVLPEVVSAFKLQNNNNNDDCNLPTLFYFSQYATNHLGFKYIDKWQWKQLLREKKRNKPRSIRLHTNNDIRMDIKGYNWIQNFSYDNDNGKNFCPPTDNNQLQTLYKITTKEKEIVIEKNSKELIVIKLEKFMETVKKRAKENDQNRTITDYYYSTPSLPQEALTYIQDEKDIRIKLLLKNIYVSEEDRLEHYHGLLLIDER